MAQAWEQDMSSGPALISRNYVLDFAVYITLQFLCNCIIYLFLFGGSIGKCSRLSKPSWHLGTHYITHYNIVILT